MTLADLDAVEEMAGTFAPEGWVRTYVPPLVAELRAAREVVEAARRANNAVDLIGTTEYSKARLSDLGDTVRAYDQAMTP